MFRDPIHFLHIGKTGGTSIIQCFDELNSRKNIPYQFYCYRHQVTIKHLPQKQKYFLSVRNPITRFISGFYATKAKNKGVQWSPEEKIAFDFFPEANDLAESLFCNNVYGARAYDAMLTIKHVAEFQCSWADPQRQLEENPPFSVLHQETLDKDFNHMLNKLELAPVLLSTMNINVCKNAPVLSEKGTNNIANWYARDFNFIERLKSLGF